ncbi:MAG: CRISPR-associated CARF protein Csa3 [Candidatus Parvarchaeota archaeon]|nr:CRISPR-associated CARF protein Csa3 [Candidatus Jingweiarchaeum tengchongense]MCW1300462.1 CRISPR-associated CARF protein Csa3 [Candidatus Jingweiarchaeum tengchongense]MCW1305492.1 CRISPR-associated CARF protein Csa3 [Candidatus Jingweiarchaeum tengchongense]MCW1309984.1 CRISPR-associated CARF protein Csa3 [Candidatus Jingweiarchaeum tengchongense]
MVKVHIVTVGAPPEPPIEGIKKFGCEVLYLIVNEFSRETGEKVMKMIEPFNIKTEMIEVDVYNIPSIVRKIRDLIRKEGAKGNEIYLNLTGGRKTLPFAVMLAGFFESQHVKKIFYVAEEGNKIVELPILPLESTSILTKEKFEILQLLGRKRRLTIKEVSKLTKKSIPICHQHLSDLEEKGFVVSEKKGKEKVFEISELGRILL